MHQYLMDTKYAASNIIDLIMHDGRELEKANKSYHKVQEDLYFYQQRLYAADMSYQINMKLHIKNPTAFGTSPQEGRLGGVKIMCSFTENWYQMI
ncbi:hypothetical protein [Richelia sinica]|uniref:hypothetical protein n=1 Tax=Richelia sinica TaxID=1357545 RepID=UPI001C2C3532|nr:hypothetical protein [Richelia sinica]